MSVRLINWLDLSAHEASLAALRFPDGVIRIVLSGVPDGSDTWNWACKEQGFIPSRTRSFLYRNGTEVKFAPFLKKFPRAERVQWPVSKVISVVGGDVGKKAPTPSAGTTPRKVTKPTTIKADVRETIPLGLNHLGQAVYEGGMGRFLRKDKDSSPVLEKEGMNPALFLHGTTPEGLALCADGFVESMARGSVMRAQDLRQFGATVHGERDSLEPIDPRLRVVQEAIEAAIQRRVSQDSVLPDRNAFDFSVRLHNRQPPLVFRTSSSVLLQQYSTVLPLAIAAQRLLGPVGGKRLMEPTIGNGALVSVVPPDTEIVGVEIDPARVAQVRDLRKNLRVIEGDFTEMAPPRELFDAVIANPPFGGLSNAVEIDGLKVSRIDHLILMRALLSRKPEGQSVFIIGADHINVQSAHAGELSGGSAYLFNWLADHYELKAVELDGHLYDKQGSGYPVRLLSVGRKYSPEEVKEAKGSKKFRMKRLEVLRSWEEVWRFADLNGPQLLEPIAEVEAQETEKKAPKTVSLMDNDYQTPYAPMSKVGESQSMIPCNLQGATAKALANLEAEYGSIDDFVRSRLQMRKDEFAKAFSPEQVDAIGLAIARCEEGRGLILGDQTGLGKGRVLAGLARYAVLRKMTVTFLTEKPNLFSDFYRDLTHIGSESLFRPLIVNTGVNIRDQDNNQVIPPTNPALMREIISDMQPPGELGYNLVYATYSQFNRESTESDKALWISQAGTTNAFLIMDESHVASGESNIATNISFAANSAASCIYSSATYAKGAKNMAVYRKAFPVGFSMGGLAETLSAGGEPLQEVLSAMLAEDGAFIRREQDLSKITYETVIDDAHRARNEALADKLSEILQLMSVMSGDVDKIVGKLKKNIKKKLEDLTPEQRKGNRMGVSYVNFGSRLYALLRQFQLALNVEITAQAAIKDIQEGRKPVIGVEQTVESLVRETVMAEYSPGDADKDNVGIASLSSAISIPALTFRDVLHRCAEKIDRVILKNAYGVVEESNPVELAETPRQAEAWMELKESLRKKIDAFPDLPLSPVDSIREAIERAGFTCGEISGRKLSVSSGTDGEIMVLPRSDDRLNTIYAFNNGETDALIVTRAGATGLSLHSSEQFKDQRKRHLYELQIFNNVSERVQLWGRVGRRGEVVPPGVFSISSGLPAEIRQLSMQNAKLRKLSANTQSNRNNAAEIKEVPDILNNLGSEVCLRFLENNPEYITLLGLELSGIEDKMVDQPEWLSNHLMGHIAILPIKNQKEMLTQLFDEYNQALKELDALGENPFRAQEYDWKARVISREIMEGVEGDNTSPFRQPVYLTRVQYEREIKPYRYEELLPLMEHSIQELENCDGLGANTAATGTVTRASFVAMSAPLIRKINQRFDELKEAALENTKFSTVDQAILAKDANPVKNLEERRREMARLIPGLYPGALLKTSTDEGGDQIGIVVSLLMPPSGKETHAGKYTVSIAYPGAAKLYETSLNALMNSGAEPVMSWGKGLTTDEVFAQAPAGMITYTKTLLEGNLFNATKMAVSRNLGRTIIYTDEQNIRRRAVLVKSSMTADDVKNIPLSLDSAEQMEKILHLGGKLYADEKLEAGEGAVLLLDDYGQLMISTPGSRAIGGRTYLNKDLVDLIGNFTGGRARMVAKVPPEKISDALNILKQSGDFFVSSQYREALMAIRQEEFQRAVDARKQEQAQSQATLMAACA